MNLSQRLSIVSVALLIALAATSALAGVPLVTSYQGRLLDASDQPVNGTFNMVFQIYDVPVGGTPLWTEDQVGVQVTDGLFTVALGATVPLSAELLTGGGGGSGGSSRYLQIQIAGQPPISPRTRLAAAPFAVASGSVSGDVQTSPGRVVAGDLDGDGFLDISSSSDQSELHIARKRPGKVKYSNLVLRVMPDSLTDYRDTDSDDDGVPETEFLQRLTPTTSSLAIKTKGTSAQREIKASTDSDSATILMTDDLDGDGVPETSVSQSSNSNGAEVSLKTRIDSTPVRLSTNFTVSKQSQGVDFGQRYDADGDGVPESEISQSVRPTTSGVAIKTKGTGADANRVLIIENRATPGELTSVSSIDNDGDTVPESEISHSVTPTTSSMAIKVKGTGADKDRWIGGNCDDSSAVHSLNIDDDGDGISEARGIISVKAATGSGSMSASSRMACDSDDDGVDDNEASMIVTPTTSGVAIKTKGTGADANRTASISSTTGFLSAGTASVVDDDGDGVSESEISHSVTPTTSSVVIKVKGTGADKDRVISSTTDTAKAVTVHSADIDGDGVADRVIREQCDDDDASITVARGSSEIKIKHKGWDGTIKGRMAIESSGAIQVDFAGDGIGFVSQRFGVGVLSPTHPVEHSSGAHLTAGGVWTNASDENLKENFQPVDGQELLEKIAELPISQWNYKSESDEVRHIGPTAQDFQTVFGVGSDGKSISTIDPAGIALAAAKELSTRLNDKTKRIDQLEGEIQQLRALVNKLLSEKK